MGARERYEHGAIELRPRLRTRESWEDLVRSVAPAEILDPVYTDVKGRSTRYCAFYLGQAQDVDAGLEFF